MPCFCQTLKDLALSLVLSNLLHWRTNASINQNQINLTSLKVSSAVSICEKEVSHETNVETVLKNNLRFMLGRGTDPAWLLKQFLKLHRTQQFCKRSAGVPGTFLGNNSKEVILFLHHAQAAAVWHQRKTVCCVLSPHNLLLPTHQLVNKLGHWPGSHTPTQEFRVSR